MRAASSRIQAGFPLAIIILLSLVIVVSTADRQIIALIKPLLDKTYGWSARDYATISFWTQVAAACSLLVSGWLVDRFGPRRVLGIALTGWSLMTVLHAVVTSVLGFVLVRSALGALEGAGMPSLMKLITQCVPRARRGQVIGTVNAVPNVAAVLTPFLVGLLLPWVGWKALVVGLGVAGLLLAALWRVGISRSVQGDDAVLQGGVPHDASALASSPKEAALASSPGQGEIRRFVVVFSVCKVLSDATWWLLLYWLPDILHTHFGLGLRAVGMASGGVYLAAGLGSVCGGVLPALLYARMRPQTTSREGARRLVMAGSALCVVPMLLVYTTHGPVAGMALFALALMAHQVFSTNLFGLVTEWAPQALIGRMMGIGAFCGNLGGAALLWLTGFVPMPFILDACSLAYLAAWVVLYVWTSPAWLAQTFPGGHENPVSDEPAIALHVPSSGVGVHVA